MSGLVRGGFSLFICLSLAACASVRYEGAPAPGFVEPAAQEGPVAEFANSTLAGSDENASALSLLRSSTSAFEARAAVLDAAMQTLDIQYFIWQGDVAGNYLLERVLAAADRGVRVRLIVDDLSASGRDRAFYALAEHENVAIRIFNPFRGRVSMTQAMEFMFRFGTLNHRMHNKAIIADGLVGIIGGRNIGDRYFGMFDEFVQHDLDIMFTGEIVSEVQTSFDEFWNAPRAVPVREYLRPARMKLGLDGLRTELHDVVRHDAELLEGFELRDGQWLQSRIAQFDTGRASFMFDAADVDDIARGRTRGRMKNELYDFLATATEEIVISMAYFIPDEALSTLLESAARRGVRVVLLTNSVQSNNHMLAHVAYKRARRRSLLAGIELYELRPDASYLTEQAVPPVTPGFVGLHTKAAVVDGSRALIGTANLDPRALDINTESAIVFDGQQVATELRRQILDAIQPDNAWQLRLDERGQPVWRSGDETLTREPVRGLMQRIKMFMYILLPLKDQA